MHPRRAARSWLAAGCLALALAAPARAVISFTEEGGVRLSSAVPFAVVPSALGWRLYISSNGFDVLSATSTNQLAWSLEAGVRLSTTQVAASSITSASLYFSTNAADPLRMYFTALGTDGRFSVRSATSADGLAWSVEPSTRLAVNAGASFLGSVQALPVSASRMSLFFIADENGGNDAADYRILHASSSDGGLTFSTTTSALPGTQAYSLSITTLTDGRLRAYYGATLTGQTTVSQMLSAVGGSATDLTLEAESGVRVATTSAAAELLSPVVFRSTEAHKWRMLYALRAGGSTAPFVTSALANTPKLLKMTPTEIINTGTATDFSLTGEILGAGAAVSFTQAGATITATGVTAPSDLSLSGALNPLGKGIGAWTAIARDATGESGFLANAFVMAIQAGKVTITDNLFRPLQGGSAAIALETFAAGHVTLRLYTSDGALVATLADQDFPAGTSAFTWNGRGSGGAVVASGLYLLSIKASGIEETRKIVIIK